MGNLTNIEYKPFILNKFYIIRDKLRLKGNVVSDMKEINFGYLTAIFSHKDQYDQNIIVMKVTGIDQNLFIDLVDSQGKIPIKADSNGGSGKNRREGVITLDNNIWYKPSMGIGLGYGTCLC